MTERYAAFLVTLTHDMREDDAEHVINAINMIKSVRSVTPVPADIPLAISEERAYDRIRGQVIDLLTPRSGL